MRSLFFALLLLLLGCTDEFTAPFDPLVPVTHVRSMCGHAVLKIQDSRYYYLGEETDGETNVFLGRIECFAVIDPNSSEVFLVQLNPRDFNTDCAVCMGAISYAGNKHYNVRVVTDTK